MEYHPDRNLGKEKEVTENFKKIRSAFEEALKDSN